MSETPQDKANPSEGTDRLSESDHDNRAKLGRDKPGEGLDTGVDTGAIQPGQSGNNGKLG